jgi:Raf kinase inhibitor-like YbhB/YbcL family protein
LPDGSLLVSDDSNNMILRVAYGTLHGKPAQQQLASEIFADAPATIGVRSSGFTHRGQLDVQYTDYGAGRSPPLSWSNVPDGTRSLVLMMEDPRATTPLPFVHWTVANLPPDARGLPGGVGPQESPAEAPAARQGSNSRSATGYFGPRPPPGDEAHPYHFQVFALDRRLRLPSGFNRKALLDAMAGHVLARGEIVGRFAMPLPEEGIGPEDEEEAALLEVPGWDRDGPEPAL